MQSKKLVWMGRFAAILALAGCDRIIGIEDPIPFPPDEVRSWATWPMPNPPSGSLPNAAKYTVFEGDDVVEDDITGLTWQRTVDAGTFTWEEAKAYCKDLEQGRFEDWRLPSRIELVSLLDFTKSAPAIDTDVFLGTPSADFWTSSPRHGDPSAAWAVDFATGETDDEDTQFSSHVRCVH